MGHSILLARDLLHFVEETGFDDAEAVAGLPCVRLRLPIQRLATRGSGARVDAASLTVGDLVNLSRRRFA